MAVAGAFDCTIEIVAARSIAMLAMWEAGITGTGTDTAWSPRNIQVSRPAHVNVNEFLSGVVHDTSIWAVPDA